MRSGFRGDFDRASRSRPALVPEVEGRKATSGSPAATRVQRVLRDSSCCPCRTTTSCRCLMSCPSLSSTGDSAPTRPSWPICAVSVGARGWSASCVRLVGSPGDGGCRGGRWSSAANAIGLPPGSLKSMGRHGGVGRHLRGSLAHPPDHRLAKDVKRGVRVQAFPSMICSMVT